MVSNKLLNTNHFCFFRHFHSQLHYLCRPLSFRYTCLETIWISRQFHGDLEIFPDRVEDNFGTTCPQTKTTFKTRVLKYSMSWIWRHFRDQSSLVSRQQIFTTRNFKIIWRLFRDNSRTTCPETKTTFKTHEKFHVILRQALIVSEHKDVVERDDGEPMS